MLETVIAENTVAIRDLIATIAKGLPTSAAQVAAVVDPAPKETTKKQVKATVTNNGASSTPETPPFASADAAAQGPAPVADSPSAPGAVSVTYDDVKAAILKLSNVKGRDAVLALLKPFGAAKGPELKPEQFAEFVTQANAAIAS